MSKATLERYKAICEASPDVIILVDSEGKIIYANTRVTDLLGYEPDELIGEPVERLVPESQREGHVQQRDAYIEKPQTRSLDADFDLEARCKDGSTTPVDISLSPIESDGKLEVMAAVRDIREQKTLRRKYQTILEAVPDAVIIADTDAGKIVEANNQVVDLLGYNPEELIGEEQTILHPSTEAVRYRALFAHHVADEQFIVTQFPDGSDIYVETKDDEQIPVEINARVFELSGKQLIAGVVRNITARKERERQLRKLTETTRELMEAKDSDKIAGLVANAANTTLGHTSTVVRLREDGTLHPVAVTDQAKIEMGTRPADYPIDGDHPVSQAYTSEEVLLYDDVTEVRDDHDRGTVRSAMYLPIDGHGVISIVDIEVDAFDEADAELVSTLAATAETALNRLETETKLRRQNERLEEFANIVSHDLRNPLTVAQGWLDVAQSNEATVELERVENALERMDEIIKDTLTLARQGQTVGERDRIEIAHLAGECWEMVLTADAQLEVINEFQIRGDRDRLHHVFENLFRNAIEHGGDDVTVTIGLVDEGTFYVKDDGPGIPEDKLSTVFKTGYTTSQDGTGLGLTIVKQVVEAHGWEVQVANAEDGGSKFGFTVSADDLSTDLRA